VQGLAITGSQGRLGQRLLQLLLDAPDVTRVVGLDVIPPDPNLTVSADVRADNRFCIYVADLGKVDLLPLLADCDVLVHLASEASAAGESDGSVVRGTDRELTRVVLEAATEANIKHVVIMSSAVVYGAWPDNPVPMTEANTPKPNPGFAFAESRLEIEALANEWRNARSGRTLTVLRPAASPAAAGTGGWLASCVPLASGSAAVDVAAAAVCSR
jgi:UDP-glucose 4-epimerase